ncbi:MAG: hypothetical protein J6X55_07110, partial [Victivallales bacterium]|nr:hypothetical protein [Victivallales bacterium]
MSLFAHSNGPDKATWQLLEDHLENVASSAANYAKPFNSSFHAQLLGWIHDIGKARTSFQSYLFHCNGIEDIESDFSDHSHSGAGACWLASRSGTSGTTLA